MEFFYTFTKDIFLSFLLLKIGENCNFDTLFPIFPRFWYPKRVTRVSRTSFLLVFMDTHDAQAPLRHNTLGDTVQY